MENNQKNHDTNYFDENLENTGWLGGCPSLLDGREESNSYSRFKFFNDYLSTKEYPIECDSYFNEFVEYLYDEMTISENDYPYHHFEGILKTIVNEIEKTENFQGITDEIVETMINRYNRYDDFAPLVEAAIQEGKIEKISDEEWHLNQERKMEI